MFPVVTNDGVNVIPNDDVVYIVGKKGIFLKKKVGIVESLIEVNDIPILEDVKQYAKLHINKIPARMFARVSDFFKEVYSTYRSEAIVLLLYNEDEGKYVLHIPNQVVTGGGLDYVKPISPKGYVLLGTIHSHAGFSAFHSGVDDHDEKEFDGLHITIGHNGDENFSLSVSVVINGKRFKVEASEYVENIKAIEEIKEDDDVEEYSEEELKAAPWKRFMGGKGKIRFKKIDDFRRFNIVGVKPSKRKCNPNWMTKVSEPVREPVEVISHGIGNADLLESFLHFGTEEFDKRFGFLGGGITNEEIAKRKCTHCGKCPFRPEKEKIELLKLEQPEETKEDEVTRIIINAANSNWRI